MSNAGADLVSPELAFLLNACRLGRPVRVAAELVDDEGTVVASQGDVLDDMLARRINAAGLQGRLQLRLPARLDRHKLRERLLELPARYPDVQALADGHPMKDIISKALNRFQMGNTVVDLLTLLSHRLPQRFEHTLFGTWLGALLVKQLDLPRKEQDAVLQACLLRDVGYLYVTPALLDAKDASKLDRASREQLRAHAKYGATVAEAAESVNDEAALAIRWHHSRIDGSGYPPRPAEIRLEFFAQLVGLVDEVAEARLEGAEDGVTLERMRKLLVLSIGRFDSGILSAYFQLVSGLRLEEEEPDELERARLVEVMLNRVETMEEMRVKLEDEVESRALDRRVPAGSPLPRLARRLVKVMRQSGHGSSELVWWLKAVRSGRDAPSWSDLIDIDLQQRELQKEMIRLTEAIEEVAPWTRKDIVGPELI